jgi:hypothetical protein
MSNEELSKAIETAFAMMNQVSDRDTLHYRLKRHLQELLDAQSARAKEAA